MVDVAHLAAEIDCASYLRGITVQHGLGAARLIGRPHRAPDGIVGEPIGIRSRRSRRDLHSSALVEHHQAVGVSRRRVYPVFAGHHQHAMHASDPANRAHDAQAADVDLDYLAGTEMRDEQEPATRVQAFVVESRAVTRQRDLPDRAQTKWNRLRLLAATHHDDGHESANRHYYDHGKDE